VIDEAVAALGPCDQASPACPDERRRDVRQLFRLVLRCMHAGRAEPVIRPSEQIAAHCYAAGIDLTEAQEAFNVLTEVLWRHLADALGGEQLVQALGLLNAIVGSGKDAMARMYVALATRDGNGQDEQPAGDSSTTGAASEDRARDVVRTSVVGQVGIITLEDRHKHNAIGAQLATEVILRACELSRYARSCSGPRRECACGPLAMTSTSFPRPGGIRWATTIRSKG